MAANATHAITEWHDRSKLIVNELLHSEPFEVSMKHLPFFHNMPSDSFFCRSLDHLSFAFLWNQLEQDFSVCSAESWGSPIGGKIFSVGNYKIAIILERIYKYALHNPELLESLEVSMYSLGVLGDQSGAYMACFIDHKEPGQAGTHIRHLLQCSRWVLSHKTFLITKRLFFLL